MIVEQVFDKKHYLSSNTLNMVRASWETKGSQALKINDDSLNKNLTTILNRYFSTIGRGFSEDSNEGFSLTSNGQFLDSISKGILFRIPINSDLVSPFLASLSEDLKKCSSTDILTTNTYQISLINGDLSLFKIKAKPKEKKESSNWFKAVLLEPA